MWAVPCCFISNHYKSFVMNFITDDKLSRIKNKGLSDITEDTIMDLTGYLILLMVERKKNNNKIINELIKKKDERKSF